MLLYKTLLRSSVTYACPIWIGTFKTNLQKIQTLQNKYAKIATKAPWFIRSAQIQCEITLQPLYNFIHKVTQKYLYKLSLKDLGIGSRSINFCLKPHLPQDIVMV